MLREAGDLLLRRVFCQEKSRSGFFALAGAAGSEAGVEIQTEIETYMILGADHEVQSSSTALNHHQEMFTTRWCVSASTSACSATERSPL